MHGLLSTLRGVFDEIDGRPDIADAPHALAQAWSGGGDVRAAAAAPAAAAAAAAAAATVSTNSTAAAAAAAAAASAVQHLRSALALDAMPVPSNVFWLELDCPPQRSSSNNSSSSSSSSSSSTSNDDGEGGAAEADEASPELDEATSRQICELVFLEGLRACSPLLLLDRLSLVHATHIFPSSDVHAVEKNQALAAAVKVGVSSAPLYIPSVIKSNAVMPGSSSSRSSNSSSNSSSNDSHSDFPGSSRGTAPQELTLAHVKSHLQKSRLASDRARLEFSDLFESELFPQYCQLVNSISERALFDQLRAQPGVRTLADGALIRAPAMSVRESTRKFITGAHALYSSRKRRAATSTAPAHHDFFDERALVETDSASRKKKRAEALAIRRRIEELELERGELTSRLASLAQSVE